MHTDHQGYCVDARGKRNGRRIVAGHLIQDIGERKMVSIEAQAAVQRHYPGSNCRKVRVELGRAEHVVYDRPRSRAWGSTDDRLVLGRGRLAPDAWKDAYAKLPDSAKIRPTQRSAA